MEDTWRFSFYVYVVSREQLVRLCRRGEEFGYDAIYIGDHLGPRSPAPFPTIAVAAAATERMRVGTYVLNVPFWNSHMLAREIATTDVLIDGRLEVGLGVGYMKSEFDAAGIPWEGFGARAKRLESTICTLSELFQTKVLRPGQRIGFGRSGPPLIVGGTGDRILEIAGRYADIISIAGKHQIPGQPPGKFHVCNAASTLERVEFARAAAGSRANEIEWNLLIKQVVMTADRRAAAAEFLDGQDLGLTVDEALETPYLLFGTATEIADQLRANRERYGFTHVTVHERSMEAFGPIIAELR